MQTCHRLVLESLTKRHTITRSCSIKSIIEFLGAQIRQKTRILIQHWIYGEEELASKEACKEEFLGEEVSQGFFLIYIYGNRNAMEEGLPTFSRSLILRIP